MHLAREVECRAYLRSASFDAAAITCGRQFSSTFSFVLQRLAHIAVVVNVGDGAVVNPGVKHNHRCQFAELEAPPDTAARISCESQTVRSSAYRSLSSVST